jgi:hypothetical protein
LALALRHGLVILLLLGGTAVNRLQADELNLRDLQHEVLARHALSKDLKLAELNLVVRVKDRVATLQGPVPTRDLGERAVTVLKKLPELRAVRNELTVQFEDQLLLPRPPAVLPEVSPPPREQKPAPAPPQQPLPKTETPTTAAWKPVHPQEPVKPALHGVALLPSITMTPAAGTVSRPKDAGPAQPADPPDAAAISSAVQSLIQGDERYRRLRYEVKQGKIYLGGVVYRWSDLHELSRGLVRIPGVESVVLRDIRAEPRK